MSNKNDFPSYTELFGELDFKKGDEARSVYSPAAYLADLVQLLDDNFDNPNLDKRRADIKQLVLNNENTFSLIPYLDIVNELLEHKIKGNAYDVLKKAQFPFNLPFSLENERIKKYLHYLNIGSEEIYKLFNLKIDPNIVAREYLQLSEEDYTFFIKVAANENAIKAFYNLKPADDLNSLKDVPTFLRTTGLSGMELRELLFQNLSKSEAAQASLFFTNNGLGGYAKLDENEENIFWVDSSQENEAMDFTDEENEKPENLIPSAWFERVNRLIRLAKKIEVSITDLDIILRTCCANQLDTTAIQRIAVIKKLQKNYELPIDEVCAFFSNINTLGIGNDDESTDLFNRLFNENYAEIDKQFIKGSQFLPKAFSGYNALQCFGDILSIENKIYRKRLTKALGISENSLTIIVNKFREKALTQTPKMTALSPEIGIGNTELSLLFRISKMAQTLDTSIEEVLDILELLENDPFIRKYDNFNILIHNKIETLDCFKIISGTDIQASMWLTQILFTVTIWMQENNFTANELQFLQTGVPKNEKTKNAATKKKINSLNNLYQQFKPIALNAEYFKSDQFDNRSANVIFNSLKTSASQLVSKHDDRIINYNSSRAERAASDALNSLKILRKEDFTGLGLEEKMQDKIFNNLIIKGYLNTEGQLNEDAIPNNPADFKINNSSTEENKEVFEVIHNLFVQENEKGVNYSTNGGDVLTSNGGSELSQSAEEFAVFLSDFDGLHLTQVRKTELYDNLIFNGYINEEGTVLKPQFFSEDDNYVHFDANANIDVYSKAVYDIIQHNIAQFKSRKLKLDKEVFASLPLKEIEINDLIENLMFNEYIDDQNVFTNKAEMLSLDVKDFNLALMFYPYRHKILDAIKQTILAFKANFYTLRKDSLNGIADEIVAGLVFNAMEADYLENGTLSKENILFFSDDENQSQFKLGNYFDDNTKSVVFRAIQKMVMASEKYQLNEFDLLEFGLDEDNLETLTDQLIEDGYIQKDGSISASRLDYYLNINNALDFKLDGFQDFNKDIFFVIHAVAKEIDAALNEISEKLKVRAEQQERVLFEALQEAFEISSDTIKVICKHLFKHSENILEEFLLPILSSVDTEDKITKEPQNNKFNYAYRRILQFGRLASKLGLNKTETDIVFRDQDLVEKFPEKLVLPKGIDRFDALLELKIDASNYEELEEEGMINAICIFNGSQFWAYAADNYNLLISAAQLSTLSPGFEGIQKVDAAFKDEKGSNWLISGANYFCKAINGKKWEKKDRIFGKVESNFDDLEKIDASFIDSEGKTYLFSGNQYLRYSDSYTTPDEGYPKKIKGNWKNEHEFEVPIVFEKSIDAAFQSADDRIYFFKEDKFVSSDDFNNEVEINKVWGKIKNNFDDLSKLDAAFTFNDKVYVFSGDQVIAYSNSIENEDVFVDEGYPMLLKNWIKDIPDAFEDGIDAIFKGNDDKVHIIKGKDYVSYELDLTKKVAEKELTKVWGKVRNNIATNGGVNAAFTGLDGKAYLFSGDQFYRYSGSSYAKVDEGYPKTISTYWGGLDSVDAAFVLDGKTYLFGKFGEGESKYVRYSTKDYSNHDEGYPMSPDDNWWSIHFNLVESEFNEPDAIFNDLNGKTYLFKGSKFIAYDNKHRWWSASKNLKENWDSIPFKSVDAAFTGKDGKSYLFSQKKYIRYSDQNFNKIDDRYPKVINAYWGNVTNNIEKSKKIDSALVVDSQEFVIIEGQETEQFSKHTYLFSGNQFFRYTGNSYDFVDEGYPKVMQPALKEEPRFKNLKTKMEKGVDAAFADRRNIYLFKDNYSLVVSSDLYEEYTNMFDQNISSAFIENGKVFIGNQNGWSKYSSLEGISLSTENVAPTLLREVPDEFKTGLDAVLDGTDSNSYLFQGKLCYNVSLDRAYELNEEWGRVKNNIYIHNQIDAAFVGMDGKTYLFSGDQFVCYTPKKGAEKVIPEFVDTNLKIISEHWGGLANVQLAFIREDKTYLFEKPNDKGIFRFVCYSTGDYSKPDSAAQMADLNWWGFPSIYMDEGFLNVNAVLFEDDNMFLINEDSFIQFDQAEGVWTYPRPLDRVWSKFPFDEHDFVSIKTAFKGIDNKTYFFSDETYVSYKNGIFSSIKQIKSDWGIVDNNIVRKNKIDAAFVLNGKTTYLFSGDQYVKYSTNDYRYIDDNYPKTICEDLRKEEGFKNLPDSFEERLKELSNSANNTIIDGIISNSRNIFIFEGNNCHVVSQTITEEFQNIFIGAINNNIENYNEVDAAFVSDEHTFLFSGDQYFRYSGTDYN